MERAAQPSSREGPATGDHWNIGAHAFVDVDPALAASLEQLTTELGPHALLTARAVLDAWGQDRVGSTGDALIFHLRPEELKSRTPEPPLTLRRLTPDDAALVQALNAACTPEEAEEGYVAADHEIALACCDGDRPFRWSAATGATVSWIWAR
jgi:hypothetical protein